MSRDKENGMAKELTCPRTGVKLTPVICGDVEVDVSEGCGGIWLSKHALEHLKFDDHDAAHELIDLAERFHRPIEDASQRLPSPAAPDVVMMRRYYSPLRKVEIDECPATGGIWLDPGEFATIRRKFSTREEYERVGRQFIDEVMNSPEIRAYKAESQAIAERLDRVSNVLWRFIPPFGKSPERHRRPAAQD